MQRVVVEIQSIPHLVQQVRPDTIAERRSQSARVAPVPELSQGWKVPLETRIPATLPRHPRKKERLVREPVIAPRRDVGIGVPSVRFQLPIVLVLQNGAVPEIRQRVEAALNLERNGIQ